MRIKLLIYLTGGRYKGKVMEGVEKEDLEDDGDRLERSNKDVVLVGDSQMPKSSSKIRIDDRVEAKTMAGINIIRAK